MFDVIEQEQVRAAAGDGSVTAGRVEAAVSRNDIPTVDGRRVLREPNREWKSIVFELRTDGARISLGEFGRMLGAYDVLGRIAAEIPTGKQLREARLTVPRREGYDYSTFPAGFDVLE